ncbi:hypothetical protein [Sphaerisporangium dianthi]|uniref:Transposase (putative) YhgA-like domain-containing protein n=1 Tax=Sphaerisporangium dianthi TaxID=1436120 RepID=A0ABV9CPU7_9ACTN
MRNATGSEGFIADSGEVLFDLCHSCNVAAMPYLEHEALILLFKNRPALAAELLGEALAVALPQYSLAEIEPGDLTECSPAEYRADAVVVLSSGDKPVLAVVVEVQRGRDPHKRWSWPMYLASVRARKRCPAVLLVVCTDTGIARWCATPIDMGHPGWRLIPMVAGPKAVPVVTDRAAAVRAPELAVLSAVAHGGDLEVESVLAALIAALSVIDDEQARLYADFVLMMLPEAARKHMEVLMATGTYEYQSDFAQKYVAEGKAEGKAEAVLILLGARGVAVSEEVRQRILGCAEAARLDEWIQRAATARVVDDLFR